MYTTRIAGSTDKDQVFAIPAAPAAPGLHPDTEAAIAAILDDAVAPRSQLCAYYFPAWKRSNNLVMEDFRIEAETQEEARKTVAARHSADWLIGDCRACHYIEDVPAPAPKPSAVTMEIKIDLRSPEMQESMRKSADFVAMAATSVEQASQVIQALDAARSESVGPTHTLDHMIAALERRAGRLEYAVKVEAAALLAWRNNWAVAQSHARAKVAREMRDGELVRWSIGEARKIRLSRF